MSNKLGTNRFTAAQVAAELGVCVFRVYALAKSRRVGSHFGRSWIFTAKDIDAMRIRKPGNPRAHRKPPLNLDTAIPWSAV